MALAFVRPPLPPPSTHHHYSFLGARFRRSNTILISLLSSCLLVLVFPITSIRADDHPGEGNLTAVLLEGMFFFGILLCIQIENICSVHREFVQQDLFFSQAHQTTSHFFLLERKVLSQLELKDKVKQKFGKTCKGVWEQRKIFKIQVGFKKKIIKIKYFS